MATPINLTINDNVTLSALNDNIGGFFKYKPKINEQFRANDNIVTEGLIYKGRPLIHPMLYSFNVRR